MRVSLKFTRSSSDCPALSDWSDSPRNRWPYRFAHPTVYGGDNTVTDLEGTGVELPRFADHAPIAIEYVKMHPDVFFSSHRGAEISWSMQTPERWVHGGPWSGDDGNRVRVHGDDVATQVQIVMASRTQKGPNLTGPFCLRSSSGGCGGPGRTAVPPQRMQPRCSGGSGPLCGACQAFTPPQGGSGTKVPFTFSPR